MFLENHKTKDLASLRFSMIQSIQGGFSKQSRQLLGKVLEQNL